MLYNTFGYQTFMGYIITLYYTYTVILYTGSSCYRDVGGGRGGVSLVGFLFKKLLLYFVRIIIQIYILDWF